MQKERQAVYGTWLLYQSERGILSACDKREDIGVQIAQRAVGHRFSYRGTQQKPDEARARIEALYGEVPKIELFARQTVGGWDCWGNETEKFGRH